MSASMKWAVGSVGVIAIALGMVLSMAPPSDGAEEPPVPALADGEWFGMVIVGEDETGAVTLGVDVAEMLSGEDARRAAVEDGVLEEGEDLPNDFYIDNPELVYELLHLSDNAEILVISGNDVSQMVAITAADLAALYDGTYSGAPIYGIVAGLPIAMDVTVAGGVITGASAVYLP